MEFDFNENKKEMKSCKLISLMAYWLIQTDSETTYTLGLNFL